MDRSRLRIGSKVKMLEGAGGENPYYIKGQIGLLVGGTCFHDGDGPADSSGDYWLRGLPPTEAGHKANANRVCIGDSAFKVLKY